jgi:hypothetical protein
MRLFNATALTALLILTLATGAAGSTIVIPDNGSSVYFQENPANQQAVRALGQTFQIVSVSETMLTDVVFYFTPATQAQFDYRLYIYEWDSANSRATGTPRYMSLVRNGSQAPSFSNLQVALASSTTYIAFLTTQGVVNNGFADGLLQHNSGNVYAGGQAFSLTTGSGNASSGNGSWTTSSWSAVNGNSDFRFSATFATAVPEPSSLMLMGPCLAGIALWARRRRMR